MATDRPNILVILCDQLRHPPVYETSEVRRFRREELSGAESLRRSGITFRNHYTMSAACAPSRACLITGHYPSLHGVTQTDGLAKDAESDDMSWLAPNTVPTMGSWFRAGGYRTFYKGKWHVSHAHLDAPDGNGYLQSINDDSTAIPENVAAYLEADLLDAYGFSEWVGPEPHGLGKTNTGTAKDPYTADETIDLLKRLDEDGSDKPWLTVCSMLNPHDIAIFGVVALAQGLRYDNDSVPHIPDAPTHEEDLSTKPSCQKSYNEVWGKMLAPQPWIETQRRFYYQLQKTVDDQIGRVLDALKATNAYENTIVVFTSDHGDLLGAHGGMHQKWHNAYEETAHVPFVVAGPPVDGAPREIGALTSHADLLPTMLGLAGIDHDEALKQLASDHTEARPLVGRDLSGLILDRKETPPSDPVIFVTDDEISEGSAKPGSPFQRWARRTRVYETVVQPNHIETVVAKVAVDDEDHVVKLSRYFDNQQFWTVPGERDERLSRRKITTVTDPEPDQYELYDLTVDPLEIDNLAFPAHADARSHELQERMRKLLVDQLEKKRLVPSAGEVPGYRPPVVG